MSAGPVTLLLLGTDAAGKDHSARLLQQAWERAGYRVEKRAGWFSAPASRLHSSESKGRIARWRQWLFIQTFPVTQRLIPLLLPLLIGWDLRRFRPPSARRLLVISYTPVRLLAFCLGQRSSPRAVMRLSPALDRALRAIVVTTGSRAIVLDIDPAVRRRRIDARIRCGTVDPFDRYMAHDSERAERIEQWLVWIATEYLQAITIENNDLDDAVLCERLTQTAPAAVG